MRITSKAVARSTGRIWIHPRTYRHRLGKPGIEHRHTTFIRPLTAWAQDRAHDDVADLCRLDPGPRDRLFQHGSHEIVCRRVLQPTALRTGERRAAACDDDDVVVVNDTPLR